MIIGCDARVDEHAIYEIHKSASVVIPNTLPMMKWEISMHGMIIGLGKEIPQQIYDHIQPFMHQLVANTPAYYTHYHDFVWALHPGNTFINTSL